MAKIRAKYGVCIIGLELELGSCECSIKWHKKKEPVVGTVYLKGWRVGILKEIEIRKEVLNKTIEIVSKLIHYKPKYNNINL